MADTRHHHRISTTDTGATGTRSSGAPSTDGDAHRWDRPETGLWVASTRSPVAGLRHEGRVERDARCFRAFDGRGSALGTFRALRPAMRRVEGVLEG